MEGMTVAMSTADRRRAVLVKANELFNKGDDWLSFFRAVLGVKGIAREMFPDQEAFREFEQSDEFAQIETMLLSLRAEKRNPKPNGEPTRVITVRLPASLHEALRVEASDHRTSINKLCITKLLQSLNDETIPVPAADPRKPAKSANRSAPSGAPPTDRYTGSSSMSPGAVRPTTNSPIAESPNPAAGPSDEFTPPTDQ